MSLYEREDQVCVLKITCQLTWTSLSSSPKSSTSHIEMSFLTTEPGLWCNFEVWICCIDVTLVCMFYKLQLVFCWGVFFFFTPCTWMHHEIIDLLLFEIWEKSLLKSLKLILKSCLISHFSIFVFLFCKKSFVALEHQLSHDLSLHHRVFLMCRLIKLLTDSIFSFCFWSKSSVWSLSIKHRKMQPVMAVISGCRAVLTIWTVFTSSPWRDSIHFFFLLFLK